jgi:hypothetical protein
MNWHDFLSGMCFGMALGAPIGIGICWLAGKIVKGDAG